MNASLLRFAGIAVSVCLLGACTQLGLRYASLKVDPPTNAPAIKAQTQGAWESEADQLREQFADVMYGTWPAGLVVEFGETRVVDANYMDGRGRLEETEIILGAPGREGGQVHFHLAVAYPNIADGDGPIPVIIGQTFSTNCSLFRAGGLRGANGSICPEPKRGGMMGGLFHFVLGRYIDRAPIAEYFDHGYAYANFYAASIVPDNAERAAVAMEAIRQRNPGVTASSALSYWAYGWSASIDLFETDPRIDTSRIAILGHSRHGKSALLAGAWDKRIDLVISHQSGFGGAALNRSKAGERIDRVARTYPHWFTPGFPALAQTPENIPLEQHQLIALVAPTPLLLGNGRRDVWSDPNSTYEAAVLADPVYELYGSKGLDQNGLQDFNPAADLAYSLRPGAHGITPEDVDMFLAFLDAHFGSHD